MINQVKNLHEKLPLQYLVLPLFSCCCLLASPVLIWKISSFQQTLQKSYQTAQIDYSKSQRHLSLLAGPLLRTVKSSDTNLSLDVALREAAVVLQGIQGVQLDEFTVSEGDPIEVDDDLDLPITSLQVNFEATLHHSPALLHILSYLGDIAGWRVMEIRGCAMQRLLAKPRLAAACSLEFYSWSWSSKIKEEVK